MKWDRNQAIIDLLNEKTFRSVDQLCAELQVSPATIRRDLTELKQQGVIFRVGGGAILNKQQIGNSNSEDNLYMKEKMRIAAAAARMVTEGDTIFMDAGSTNALIADQLMLYSNITIITNSLQIAHKFLGRQDVSVIVCGGTLGEGNPSSIVGPVAEAMIASFRANICFLGTLGIHTKQGVTEPSLSAARIKQKMMESSNKVVLAADRSKFGCTKTYLVCAVDQIDCMITDELAPSDEVRFYRDRGIQLTLV